MQAVDAQERKPDSVLNHYRAVLSFRKTHGALRDGDMHFIKTNLDVLAFTRQRGDEKLLFVFNLTREPVEFPVPKAMSVTDILPMPGFAPLYDAGIVKLEGLDVFCGVVA